MNKSGRLQGYGMLNLDLVLYDKFGFDLAKHSYAVTESLRVINRIILPFAILIIVCYFTKGNNKNRLDQFYAKMKTPVLANREADERELKKSFENPHRFDHLKVFPKTKWEFCRWDKVAIIGFALAFLIAVAIVGMLYFLVNLGR